MSGKCEDCKVWYVQFQATCFHNSDGIFQTKRYYRCPRCGTVYVEVDPLQDENYYNGEMIVEKYPVIEKQTTTGYIGIVLMGVEWFKSIDSQDTSYITKFDTMIST